MVANNNNEADWVMQNSSRKDYIKAVLAALQAADGEFDFDTGIFEHGSGRDSVFKILMKSELSNEFIQKWVETVFAGKSTTSDKAKKDKYLRQLYEQRPARSLGDVANSLNQAGSN